MIELAASVIVFDLDDTLYLESDFAASGFACLGRHLDHRLDGGRFAQLCVEHLHAGTRGTIFDKVLSELGVRPDPALIAEMVEVYRNHTPDIALSPDSVRFLAGLGSHSTALISDGPERTQRAKVEVLGLDRLIDTIVLTGAWPAGFGKPHPRAYVEVMERSGHPADAHVYIADNATKDFHAPRALGWQTIQIVRPGRIHHDLPPTPDHAADHRVESFDAIRLAPEFAA